MVNYKLECEEPVWKRSTLNENLETVNSRANDAEGLMDLDCFYWITSDDREEVLEITDFMMAEQVIMALAEEGESFEDVAESDEYDCKIVDERPPFGSEVEESE